MFPVTLGCLDIVVAKAGMLDLDGASFGFCWLILAREKEECVLLVPSLMSPSLLLLLSPIFTCLPSSMCFLLGRPLSSSGARGTGLKSIAPCTAAGLGSVIESTLLSGSQIDFPLELRDGIFVEACNGGCCFSSLNFCPPCLAVFGEDGGFVLLVGVAPYTLMLGGAAGADVVEAVQRSPASSVFFPATEAMPAFLELARKVGRQTIQHWQSRPLRCRISRIWVEWLLCLGERGSVMARQAKGGSGRYIGIQALVCEQQAGTYTQSYKCKSRFCCTSLPPSTLRVPTPANERRECGTTHAHRESV